MHRAGHPELRLEQILCVLPRLQAPPQLLQLRLLQRDAVPQVLDLRLRGLQLALLARRPKLLLQVFSHGSRPASRERNALNARQARRNQRAQRKHQSQTCGLGGATSGQAYQFISVNQLKKWARCLPSSSCSPVDEEGRLEQWCSSEFMLASRAKVLLVLLSPINEPTP